ncbi:MAG: DNA translocase FtsK, partial [Geitlerinemataceae cyanobacterium]
MYLTQESEMRSTIEHLSSTNILWVDTETADWKTSNPKISLIQVLANSRDISGESVYILDVLDRPKIVEYFVQQIMENAEIRKVFHNAVYDVKFLGQKRAKNIFCTLKLARKITRQKLGTTNLKLKTLAAELCNFTNIDAEPQSMDWRQRPLSDRQLRYARLDPVYLVNVHRRLLEFLPSKPSKPRSSKTDEENTMPQSQKADRSSFSATDVRVAVECPRLFYLSKCFNGRTLFIPNFTDRSSFSVGNPFHSLAQKFVELALKDSRFRSLLSPSAEQLKAEEIASGMQQLFYEKVFFDYLQSKIQENPNIATTLNQIWQGIRGLIRNYAELLVSNRSYCHGDAVISATFVDRELKVSSIFELPNGTKQEVRGQFDSLVYNFAKCRLCAVEYKTYQSVDLSAQLVQVALYSYMLQQQKNDPIDAAVYCVLPEFKDYHFTWEELEQTVHQLIPLKLQQMQEWLQWEPSQSNPPPPTSQPHLCEICPQQKRCQSYFKLDDIEQPSETPNFSVSKNSQNPPIEDPVKSHPISTPSTAEIDAIAEQLISVLKSFNIGVTYQGAAVGSSFIRVKIKPNLGVKVAAILKLSDDLKVQLGTLAPPLIAPQAGYVSVDLPRIDRAVACFEKYVKPTETPATAPVRIAIGVNLEGQLVEADLSDPNTCHFLVGGTTGSGKSEFLRSMLLSLLQRRSPQQLKIALVDPKRVTFPEFERMPWLLSPIVKDSDRAIELMTDLISEMERRYQLFETARCADLSRYNQNRIDRNKPPEPPIVCIFDEYADFMAEKAVKDTLEQSIK